MSLTYAGNLPITGLCPIVATVMADAAIAMSASFNGAVAVNAQFSLSPPTVAAILSAAATFSAECTVGAGLSLPSVSFDLTACANLTASLTAALSGLPSLLALLNASVGVFGYTYSGIASSLGGALTTSLATTWGDGTTPTSGSCTALIFGLVNNASLSPPNIASTQFASFLSGLTTFGSSGLNYSGKMTLGALCAALLAGTSNISLVINAQLAVAAALQASLSITPPTLFADASMAAAVAADLSLTLPSPSFAVSASASLQASLNAQFAAVIALGVILARFDATAFVYLYTGAANALGAAVTTSLASTWGDGTTPTSGSCNAVVLGAADSATATAMTSLFGGA